MSLKTPIAIALLLVTPASLLADAKDDWWTWRGPNRNGIAADGQTPPTTWTSSKNVVWRVKVPGRGHSSPTVVGNRVVLTTADERAKVQSVVCFDRRNGKQLWMTEIHRGGFPARIHGKNTHATPSVATDGKTLFASFHNSDSIQLTALSLEGKKLWSKKAGAFVPRIYKYGYASSPLIYKSTVIVGGESEVGGFLVAFDRKTGRQIWRTPRSRRMSFSSPIVANVAGREQLVISSDKQIWSYDPAKGKLLWRKPAVCTVTCGTLVWDDKHVFASGGYPQRATVAMAADGSGRIAWKNEVKCYEQSLLAHGGYVYAISDRGVAYCWRGTDGRQMWARRLGGNISASPILAGGNIYISNERGATFVFKANPMKFALVATNQLGNSAFATPTICKSQIFLRIGAGAGRSRQEWLYCIGKK